MINLDFDDKQLRQITSDLAATEDQLTKALRTTLAKMARWLRTQSARGLSKELNIQQKIIRRRLKSFNVQNTGHGFNVKIWFGLDPISFIYLKPRQNRTGVKARGREVKGGFIAPIGGGKRQVFKRVGKDRLPIEKQTITVKDEAESYIENEMITARKFEQQFYKTFERELKWRSSKN